jgi:hypothetical protein
MLAHVPLPKAAHGALAASTLADVCEQGLVATALEDAR